MNTALCSVVAHIPHSTFCREVGQMLKEVQQGKHSVSRTQLLPCREHGAWVGGHGIQTRASQWQPHIHGDLSKCKSAVFTLQHAHNLLFMPSKIPKSSQVLEAKKSQAAPWLCFLIHLFPLDQFLPKSLLIESKFSWAKFSSSVKFQQDPR